MNCANRYRRNFETSRFYDSSFLRLRRGGNREFRTVASRSVQNRSSKPQSFTPLRDTSGQWPYVRFTRIVYIDENVKPVLVSTRNADRSRRPPLAAGNVGESAIDDANLQDCRSRIDAMTGLAEGTQEIPPTSVVTA